MKTIILLAECFNSCLKYESNTKSSCELGWKKSFLSNVQTTIKMIIFSKKSPYPVLFHSSLQSVWPFFDSQYQDAAILSWLRCLYWAESRVGWLIWTAWLPKSQKGLSCYIHVITVSTFSKTFDSILDLEINKIRNGFALKEIKGSRSELGWLSSITHHFHVRF